VTHLQTKHEDELSDNSLSTLLSWSAVQMMGVSTCPLCSSNGPEDAPDLVDHVLRHAYDFALRALPWPKPVIHDLNRPHGNFSFHGGEEDVKRLDRWLHDAEHESDGTPGLTLCDYDTADHSEFLATNLAEYTEYFERSENGYFDDRSEDKSSRNQGGKQKSNMESSSTSSARTTPSAGLDPVESKPSSDEELRYGLMLMHCPSYEEVTAE